MAYATDQDVMLTGHKSAAITAQNTFTDPVIIGDGGVLTVEGTFSATVTLQCKSKATGSWIDVATKTAAGRYTFGGGGGDIWRAGVKTGGFTSGTVTVSLQNALTV